MRKIPVFVRSGGVIRYDRTITVRHEREPCPAEQKQTRKIMPTTMVGGQSGIPAAVTRAFSRAAHLERPKNKGTARARARLKRAANRARRRSANGDFCRATARDI